VAARRRTSSVHAEGNGKPEPEQVLRATADEREELLDHYRDTTRAGGGITICMDIGCWRPAEESWDDFLARKRRKR
jgi:hypothetical protein